MAAKRFTISTDYNRPLPEVFAHLGQHETLQAVFGVPIRTLVPSTESDNPSGVGSVRLISLGPIRFEETITDVEPGHLIRYSVTKGGLLKHHKASMRFTEQGGRTHLEHEVEMESAIPGLTPFLVPIVHFVMRLAFQRYARTWGA